MNTVKKNIIKGIDKVTSCETFGKVMFGVGLLIALIMAIVVSTTDVEKTVTKFVAISLVILGLIIGFVNIRKNEEVVFLVAAIILITLLPIFFGNIIQTFSVSQPVSKFFGELFKNIISLVVPAAIIVAFRAVFNVAKDEK